MDKAAEQFFLELLNETEIEFSKSVIYQKQLKEPNKWNYSISSTRLITNSNVIVGFNWGASGVENYEKQKEMPKKSFKELEKKDLGSLDRINPYLEKYFSEEEIENSVQTDFCFFRSKKENQITPEDLELSKSLFHKLIEFLKPKRIIGLSSKLRNHLLNNDLCTLLDELRIPSNRKTLFVAKGFYKSNGQKIPIFFLPHPNARFTDESRKKAWDFCFK